MTETNKESSISKPKDSESADAKNQDVLILLPNRTVEIRTAEDAQQQFLRGLISEQDMRDAFAAHGVTSVLMPPRGLERPDSAFARKLPEDLVEEPADVERLEVRIKRQQEKAEQREKASEAAEKIRAEAKPETDLATLQNEAAVKAAEKVEITPLNEPDDRQDQTKK